MRPKKYIRFIFIMALITAFMAEIEPAVSDAAKTNASGQDKKDWPAKVRFGIVPLTGAEDTSARYQILGQEISVILGLQVETVSTPNYLDIITGMKKGEIDFAYLGPYVYITAKQIIGVKALAMEMDKNGNPGYRSIIITRADSKINSLEQAKGKVMAFTERKSASGFLVPLLHFTHDLHVIPAKYFSKVEMAGDHLKVAQGVFNGTYDLGATNTMDLDSSLNSLNLKPEQFRILWTSELIPGAPICARPDLPQSLQDAFTEALMKINTKPEVLVKLSSGGFTKVSDQDYDIIRKLKAVEDSGQ